MKTNSYSRNNTKTKKYLPNDLPKQDANILSVSDNAYKKEWYLGGNG